MSGMLMEDERRKERAKTGEDELKSQIKKKQVLSRVDFAKSS